jgi:hypothetical protein
MAAILKLAPSCFIVASDDESLEGLQQELDDCKNDQVSPFATAELMISARCYAVAYALLRPWSSRLHCCPFELAAMFG